MDFTVPPTLAQRQEAPLGLEHATLNTAPATLASPPLASPTLAAQFTVNLMLEAIFLVAPIMSPFSAFTTKVCFLFASILPLRTEKTNTPGCLIVTLFPIAILDSQFTVLFLAPYTAEFLPCRRELSEARAIASELLALTHEEASIISLLLNTLFEFPPIITELEVEPEIAFPSPHRIRVVSSP